MRRAPYHRFDFGMAHDARRRDWNAWLDALRADGTRVTFTLAEAPEAEPGTDSPLLFDRVHIDELRSFLQSVVDVAASVGITATDHGQSAMAAHLADLQKLVDQLLPAALRERAKP